jgi:hypothetical protein
VTAARHGDHDGPERAHGVVVRVVIPNAPAPAAVLGAAPVGTLLASGVIPPDSPLVWPLVVLALGTMAYDLARRALQRRPRR